MIPNEWKIFELDEKPQTNVLLAWNKCSPFPVMITKEYTVIIHMFLWKVKDKKKIQKWVLQITLSAMSKET